MSRDKIERDIEFALNFLTGVLVLVATWEMVKEMSASKELQMRAYRAVARGAKRLSDKSLEIAGKADTKYFQFTA